MIFLGIIVSLVIFSIIVLLHEYGHYKTAKLFNIHVEEFGLGIPPRAKKLWKNKDGTLFSLNWIPLGGFVKISGESEIFLNFYDEKNKVLDKKSLYKKCKNHEDIFTKDKRKISKLERKYLRSYLSNDLKGKNFYEKNIFQKSAVLVAGVIMNFILAAFIFAFLFFFGVKPVGINTIIPTEYPSKILPTLPYALEEGIILKGEGIVLSPIENSPAEKAGVLAGDILLGVNGMRYKEITEIQKHISEKKNNQVHLYIEREICDDFNTCTAAKSDIYVPVSSEGTIGTYLSPNYSVNHNFIYNYGLKDSIKYGILETYYQIKLTFTGLSMLLTNLIVPETPEDRQEALEQVSGPIGIVSVITSSLEAGISLLLILAAIISVNLGVFNILPIPALDGGRLLLLWIRAGVDRILGKNGVSTKIENMTHIIFFLLLIALSILIAYNDIIKILS